ncbi:MAG: Asp-tRNA(Asn)/Glu-tRNA(Gln) amidotransferase subunit GatA [Candidatus Berkelbacteria bacterium]|nr:MAG: Asp-tRNA(Asn)/Glu-tRNA(Gln) amidotransferase subunit GatA [Candidatus Berkelbacteria bacterium]QQG51557.1 MAG: Asp-tRNA(Asn)/Glu-tRNA(Gln) amidotransferase subunit GatA [Candidatus Berkelbacteria bacterium]
MNKAASYSERIKTTNQELNAFLFQAENDRTTAVVEGELADMALAIKDNIVVKDWPTTAASKILEGYVSPYDATVVRRLRAKGAALLGKTNLDEFAMGSSTENSAYGVTKNPWDTSKVPGGSSGGSAVAVAAGLCDAALGSDTAGSIRQPAAFCGVTGLKPTYGSVSRYGLIALTSSIDVIGPLARDANTVERVFAAISGQDKFDQTTTDYTYKPEDVNLKGLRVGLPKELWELDIDQEIARAVKEFVGFFESRGAIVSKVSLPYLPYGLPAYYVITPAEVSANLARYDGIRFQKSERRDELKDIYRDTRAHFGQEVKRRILLGTYVLSVGHYDAYYQTAVRVKDMIRQDYERVFKSVDVLISPTTPTLPFDIGSRVKDPIAMYQSDLLTVGVNLAGIPAIALPCGFSASGMPIGAQIVAPHFEDNKLISLAKTFQAETDYHTKAPRKYS